MFKIILSMFLLMVSGLAYPEPRIFNNNRMTFREFAKLSAIISQCELKNNTEQEELKKFAKLQGLRLAKENQLSQNNIAKEVSLILYELDQKYPDVIPDNICSESIITFKNYQKSINNEIQAKPN